MSKIRGFTLIEVLVSIIILAVGLLGIAGLQVASLRNNQSSLMRSQATLAAYDMTDRIRANHVGFLAGDYNLPGATAVAACETTAGCTAAQMATNDMYVWSDSLSNTLPSGAGIVCIDSTPEDGSSSAAPKCDNTGSVYAIKIWWQDDRNNPNSLQLFSVIYQ